jgi:hypothetical protein
VSKPAQIFYEFTARPGATRWSIAAGPSVDVVLLPVFVPLSYQL